MKKQIHLYFYLLLLFSLSSSAQELSIDSLKFLLLNEKQDTTRANIMLLIAESTNADSVFQKYNTLALVLAEKNIPIAKDVELTAFKRIKATAYNNIGFDETTRGNLSNALNYYLKSLQLEKEINNYLDAAYILNNIADIYETQGNISGALDYYDGSLKMHERTKNQRGIAQAYNNIGFIYSTQGDLEKALDYYQKSYKIKKILNDRSGIAVSLSNIGYIHMLKKSDYKAMSYYLLALKTAEEINDKARMALIYSNIGGIMINQGNEKDAFANFSKGLALSKEVGDVDGISHYMYNLGDLYLKKGNADSALFYGTGAMKYAQEIGSPSLIRLAAELLKNTYKEKKNSEKALEYFELYHKMNDSVNNEETKKATYKQQLSYEYDKKETIAKAEQEKKNVENASAIKRQRIITWSVGIGLFMLLIFSISLYKRYTLTQKQKHIIDEKNKEILDSITYAKRLQDAILPPIKMVTQHFPESIILYKPKDIVAGDFYWMEVITSKGSPVENFNDGPARGQKDDTILIAAADCTGHGVPGAMVSVVCSNALNRTVKEFRITDPGKILDKVRELVVETFEKSESEVKDGMDISLCCINKKTNELLWAGANNPLWLIRNNKLIEYKPNKQPIGKVDSPTPFITHSIQLQKNDILYLFTDGYADQFGGPKGKKFKYAPMKESILSILNSDMATQAIILNDKIEAWKGNLEQVDDILILGIKV